ncbi:hypothetical protein CAEBREN_28961 [Caenorhabditis brenneri]|uniref:CUB-like domain-containing protein n=1 Tax=Caenorhabditis brenneri TaxID=135651 RepID=G0PKZ9_CAEBE|nr:hypothetical protein CAEBREN_28961 [Caenorhabditis brenneri]
MVIMFSGFQFFLRFNISSHFHKTCFSLQDNDDAPYIFTQQQFQISLIAHEKQGKFSFKVVWSESAGGNVQRFDGLDCTDTPSESCYVYAYSYDVGNRAVITASRNIDYLYYVQRLAENATLSVYEGQIDKDHLLTTISGTNYNQKLPLAVKNTVKIYKVDTMLTSVSLTNDSERAGYGKIAVLTGTGMQTVVHSFDYRQLSLEQDTSETFTADILVNFNLNVVYFDVNGNTTLDIEVYQDGLTVLSETFTKDYKPRSSGYTAFGDKISISYRTYGRATRGFEVDFVCTSKDATTPQATSPKTTAIPTTTIIQSTVITVNPTTTVIQPTVSTPVITTEKVITTTKGSSQNYALTCLLASVLSLI